MKHAPPVLGLVGGIASGKSFVAAQMAKMGCAVIDADRLVHEVLARPQIRRRVAEGFGDGVLDASGAVDRRALAETAFESREALGRLERIVHPPVLERIEAEIAAARERPGVRAVVLDAALLLEKGLDKVCDRVLYIISEEGAREARTCHGRGWAASELARRESMQIPLKAKRARADDTIDNRFTPEHTRDQVQRLLSRIVKP